MKIMGQVRKRLFGCNTLRKLRSIDVIVFMLLVMNLPSLFFSENVTAQTPEERYMTDYPKLYNDFKSEVGGQKAHYIIAIDISSSMKSMEASVKSNLKNFISALPDGDKITLIQMADTKETEEVNLTDYTEITSSTRSGIISYIANLKFKKKGETGDGSDGYKMTELITNGLKKPGSSADMKYVFIFSDFEYWTSKNKYNKNAEPWASLKSKIVKESRAKVFGLIIKEAKEHPEAIYKTELKDFFSNFSEVKCPDNPKILNGWFNIKKSEILNDRLADVLTKKTDNQKEALVLKASGLGKELSISPKYPELSVVFTEAELDAASLAEVQKTSESRPLIGSFSPKPRIITVKAKLRAPKYTNPKHPAHTPSDPYNEVDKLLDPQQFAEYKIEVYEGKPYLAWYIGWPLVAVLGFWMLSVLNMMFLKKVTRTWNVRGTIKENNGTTTPIKGATPINPTSFCIGRSNAKGNFDVNIDGVGFCFKIESRKNISCLPLPGLKSGYYIANVGTGNAELIDAFKKTTALGNNNFKFLSKPGAFTPVTVKIKEGNKEFEIKIQ